MPDPEDTPLPADLRFLKILTGTLAGVMIVGVLTIAALLVTRLNNLSAPLPALPETVILPEGARAAAVTFARDWLVVVTEAGEILLYRPEGGAPVSRTQAP